MGIPRRQRLRHGDARRQRPRQPASEGGGTSGEGLDVGSVEWNLHRHRGKPLALEPAGLPLRIQVRAKHPRQRAIDRSRIAGDLLPRRRRTWIPGLPRRRCLEPARDEFEKRPPLLPRPACDHALGGNAVERRVVDDRGGNHVGLKAELRRGISPGHHDPRSHAPEFAGDRRRQHGTRIGLARAAASPDNGIEGRLAPREVHVGGHGRRDCLGGEVGTAHDDREHAGGHQRGEGVAEHRHQRLVERMKLEQHAPAVLEDLRDAIARGEAGDVAGAEHHSHTPALRPLPALRQPHPPKRGEVARIRAADEAAMAAEHRPVGDPRLGHHVHADERSIGIATVQHPGRRRRPRRPAPGDLVEPAGRDQQQPERGDRAGGHLLGDDRRVPATRLDGHRRIDPAVGGAGHGQRRLPGDHGPRRRILSGKRRRPGPQCLQRCSDRTHHGGLISQCNAGRISDPAGRRRSRPP